MYYFFMQPKTHDQQFHLIENKIIKKIKISIIKITMYTFNKDRSVYSEQV